MKTLADIFGVKIEKDMVKKRPMRVEDIDCSSRLEKYFKEYNGKVKHGNNKMREEFEKLPEIEQGLRHCHYDESTNIYHADAAHVEEFEWHTQFVNGAWYSFQEQQKIINMQECGATEIRMILEDSEYDDSAKLERISELLE